MSQLSNLCIQTAREYRQLEMQVSFRLSRFCHDFCSGCGDCCKADICVEAIESAWLRIVRNQGGDGTSRFSRSTGWLSSKGCRLKAGRPPLCYEFFCERGTDHFRKEDILDPILAISKLPSMAGQNALGKRHLVTLEEEEILHKLNFNRLRKKIALARKNYLHHLSLVFLYPNVAKVENTAAPRRPRVNL